MERQSLAPRTPMLDGLEGAYDVDRTGFAPAGSTLHAHETSPLSFRAHWSRLRLANVRWVLSFVPLPQDLTTLRETIVLDELATPLRLHEIRRPLPRVFLVAQGDAIAEAGVLRPLRGPALEPREDGGGGVSYARPDPHTIELRSSGPAGWLVVVEGAHPDWRAESAGVRVPILAANGRYWAVPVPAGDAELTVRYRPSWPDWSRGLAATGLLLGAVMAIRGGGQSPHA
jgi:hypothetical protein